MYNGNPNLRYYSDEIEYTKEMKKELLHCMDDIIYFAENFCKIVSIDEGLHLIKLWKFQKRILKIYNKVPDNKRSCCFLAPRQIGKTTLTALYVIHFILFNKDKKIAILANKESTAIDILNRIKMIYENLPLWMQVGVKDGGWNKKTITLGNGNIVLAAATGSSAVRGHSFALLILDEFAFVPIGTAEEFIRSVYPTISSGKTSKVIMSSTPCGLNHFFTFWDKAIKGENSFYPIKVRWQEVPIYKNDPQFEKRTINDIGLIAFNQEYLCKFIGSSNTLVEGSVLENLKTIEPIETKFNGLFEIFERPQEGSFYIMGVDPAEGTGNDESCIQVLKINNEIQLEQVAIYHNDLIDPYNFAQMCISVSEYYNNAYMMVEVNGVGNIVADTIWYSYEKEIIINCEKKGLGIKADKRTKLEACMLLKKYIEAGFLKINHRQTSYQLSIFEEQTPGVYKAISTGHDDLVSALYWALYFISTPFFDGRDISVKNISDRFKIDNKDDDNYPPIAFFDEESLY